MSLTCKKIKCVLELSEAAGYKIKEVQTEWPEVNEFFVMDKSLSESLQVKIKADLPGLEYWDFRGSPMDHPDQGFSCRECKVAISFPKRKLYP